MCLTKQNICTWFVEFSSTIRIKVILKNTNDNIRHFLTELPIQVSVLTYKIFLLYHWIKFAILLFTGLFCIMRSCVVVVEDDTISFLQNRPFFLNNPKEIGETFAIHPWKYCFSGWKKLKVNYPLQSNQIDRNIFIECKPALATGYQACF